MEIPDLSQSSELPEDTWTDSATDSPFSCILVPVDGSDASIEACRVAMRVAGIHGLGITALYVIENKMVEDLAAASREPRESVRRQLEEKGRRYLAHAASLADVCGVPCAAITRRGITHSQISDVAREIGADLIVIGDNRLPNTRRSISGSLIGRVIEYAPCSVLVVRPS